MSNGESWSAGKCEKCYPGFFGSVENLKSNRPVCLPCDRQTYQPQFGQISCLKCEKPALVSKDQTSCQISQCGDQEAMVNGQCQLCGAGTKPDPTRSQCLSVCTLGGKFLNGSCAKVPPGKFFDRKDKAEWKNCPPNTFQDLDGQQSCKPCPVGKIPNESATSCVLKVAAQIGQFSDQAEGGAIKACAPGTYQDVAGQTTCKLCAPGSYRAEPGGSNCLPCQGGTFQGGSGQTKCESCPNDSIAEKKSGSVSCLKCPGGTAPNVDKSVCMSTCAKNEAWDTTKSACAKCPPGLVAARNYVGDTLMVQTSSCKKCDTDEVPYHNWGAGSDKDLNNGSLCVKCPGGKKPNADNSECIFIDCKIDEIKAADGKCVPKPVAAKGQFVEPNTGGLVIKVCAPGTYQDQPGQISCKPCEPGSFQGISGQSECYACPAGSFQSLPGQTSCQSCAVGSFMSETGATECEPCNGSANGVNFLNLFCDQTGLTDTKVCDLGKKSNSDFSGCVGACAAGEVSSGGPCKKVPAGQYMTSAGDIKDCAAGTYSLVSGATDCLKCPMGSSTMNMTAVGGDPDNLSEYKGPSYPCQVCGESRTYGDQVGLAGCKVCPTGTYSEPWSDDYGAKKCIAPKIIQLPGVPPVLPDGDLCNFLTNNPVWRLSENNSHYCESVLKGEIPNKVKTSAGVCVRSFNFSQPVSGNHETAQYSLTGEKAIVSCNLGVGTQLVSIHRNLSTFSELSVCNGKAIDDHKFSSLAEGAMSVSCF